MFLPVVYINSNYWQQHSGEANSDPWEVTSSLMKQKSQLGNSSLEFVYM